MFRNKAIKNINNRLFLVDLPRAMVILFIFLQVVGMLCYPGGTIHDTTTVGYSFSENFFSGMGAYSARNGTPNYLSMIIFSYSLTLAGLTYFIYYLKLPHILGNNRFNYIIASIGSIFAFGGSICLIGTGLTPTDLVFDIHVFFANNIFHCFLISALSYSVVIIRNPFINKIYAAGYGFFCIAILVYVLILHFGPPVSIGQKGLIFQVVSQKVIVIVFLITILHQSYGLKSLEKLNRI